MNVQIPNSYYSSIRSCINSPGTIQAAKACTWLVGAGSSLLIPVPFLNGAVCGVMFFNGMNAWIRHPSGPYVSQCGEILQNRTWKHLAVGSAISAVGFSAGTWAYSLQIDLSYLLTVGGWGAGAAASFGATYYDAFVCYSQDPDEPAAPVEAEQQPPVANQV